MFCQRHLDTDESLAFCKEHSLLLALDSETPQDQLRVASRIVVGALRKWKKVIGTNKKVEEEKEKEEGIIDSLAVTTTTSTSLAASAIPNQQKQQQQEVATTISAALENTTTGGSIVFGEKVSSDEDNDENDELFDTKNKLLLLSQQQQQQIFRGPHYFWYLGFLRFRRLAHSRFRVRDILKRYMNRRRNFVEDGLEKWRTLELQARVNINFSQYVLVYVPEKLRRQVLSDYHCACAHQCLLFIRATKLAKEEQLALRKTFFVWAYHQRKVSSTTFRIALVTMFILRERARRRAWVRKLLSTKSMLAFGKTSRVASLLMAGCTSPTRWCKSLLSLQSLAWCNAIRKHSFLELHPRPVFSYKDDENLLLDSEYSKHFGSTASPSISSSSSSSSKTSSQKSLLSSSSATTGKRGREISSSNSSSFSSTNSAEISILMPPSKLALCFAPWVQLDVATSWFAIHLQDFALELEKMKLSTTTTTTSQQEQDFSLEKENSVIIEQQTKKIHDAMWNRFLIAPELFEPFHFVDISSTSSSSSNENFNFVSLKEKIKSREDSTAAAQSKLTITTKKNIISKNQAEQGPSSPASPRLTGDHYIFKKRMFEGAGRDIEELALEEKRKDEQQEQVQEKRSQQQQIGWEIGKDGGIVSTKLKQKQQQQQKVGKKNVKIFGEVVVEEEEEEQKEKEKKEKEQQQHKKHEKEKQKESKTTTLSKKISFRSSSPLSSRRRDGKIAASFSYSPLTRNKASRSPSSPSGEKSPSKKQKQQQEKEQEKEKEQQQQNRLLSQSKKDPFSSFRILPQDYDQQNLGKTSSSSSFFGHRHPSESDALNAESNFRQNIDSMLRSKSMRLKPGSKSFRVASSFTAISAANRRGNVQDDDIAAPLVTGSRVPTLWGKTWRNDPHWYGECENIQQTWHAVSGTSIYRGVLRLCVATGALRIVDPYLYRRLEHINKLLVERNQKQEKDEAEEEVKKELGALYYVARPSSGRRKTGKNKMKKTTEGVGSGGGEENSLQLLLLEQQEKDEEAARKKRRKMGRDDGDSQQQSATQLEDANIKQQKLLLQVLQKQQKEQNATTTFLSGSSTSLLTQLQQHAMNPSSSSSSSYSEIAQIQQQIQQEKFQKSLWLHKAATPITDKNSSEYEQYEHQQRNLFVRTEEEKRRKIATAKSTRHVSDNISNLFGETSVIAPKHVINIKTSQITKRPPTPQQQAKMKRLQEQQQQEAKERMEQIKKEQEELEKQIQLERDEKEMEERKNNKNKHFDEVLEIRSFVDRSAEIDFAAAEKVRKEREELQRQLEIEYEKLHGTFASVNDTLKEVLIPSSPLSSPKQTTTTTTTAAISSSVEEQEQQTTTKTETSSSSCTTTKQNNNNLILSSKNPNVVFAPQKPTTGKQNQQQNQKQQLRQVKPISSVNLRKMGTTNVSKKDQTTTTTRLVVVDEQVIQQEKEKEEIQQQSVYHYQPRRPLSARSSSSIGASLNKMHGVSLVPGENSRAFRQNKNFFSTLRGACSTSRPLISPATENPENSCFYAAAENKNKQVQDNNSNNVLNHTVSAEDIAKSDSSLLSVKKSEFHEKANRHQDWTSSESIPTEAPFPFGFNTQFGAIFRALVASGNENQSLTAKKSVSMQPVPPSKF